MNSKHDNLVYTTNSARPQKLYKGRGEAQRRRVLRDHLFSHRLHTLSKLYKGRPLPIFESSSNLLRVKVDYFSTEFELLMSRDDPWTNKWLQTLRGFSKSMDYQFSLVGSAVGAIFGAFGMSSYMSSVFNTFFKNLGGTAISIMLALGILLKSDNMFVQCQAMTLIITNLGIGFHLLSNIAWPLMPTRLFFQADEGRPFSWFPSAIAVLLTILMGGASIAQYVGIFSRTATLGYSMGSIVGLHRILTDSIKELLPYIYKLITGNDWTVEQLATNLSSFTEFIASVEDFEQHRLSSLEFDWNAQLEVYELQQKYKNLQLEAQRLGLAKSLTPVVQAYWTKIASWVKRVAASGILLAGQRAEPVSILISGKPGMGKSYMVNALVRDIGGEDIPWGEIPGEGITNHIYTRNPQEKYWSGYRGQFCTLYDDFGQIADTEASPDVEFCEVIQAVGDNAFKIPMADIEEKNRGYFRSPLLIATTNLKHFTSVSVKSIRSPEALARRFDIHVELIKKGNERMYQLMLDNTEKDVVTYPELVNICRSFYRKKQDKFKDRAALGSDKQSKVEHACVATRLLYVSGPSSIAGTELRRRGHSASNPDHSYCHPSLSCRQQRQSIWDWFMPTDNSQQEHSIHFVHWLWDPRIENYFTPKNPEEWEELKEVFRLNTPTLDTESDEFMRYGLRNTQEALQGLDSVPYLHRLMARKITVLSSKAQKNIIDGLLASSTEDLAELGLIPGTSLIEYWAGVIGRAMMKLFSKVQGIFVGIVQFLEDTLGNNPGLFIGMLTMLPPMILASAMVFVDLLKDSRQKYENPEQEEKLLKELHKRFLAKRDVSQFESRDMKGAQKSNKARSFHMTRESRNEQGAQKSNKSASIKMKFESMPPVHLLEECEVYGMKYVCVRKDLVNFAMKEGGEQVDDLIRVAFLQYAELLIEATKGGGLPGDCDTLVLNDRLVEFYNSAVRATSYEAVMNSLDATPTEKKMVHEGDVQANFQKWLKHQDFKLEYQGSSDQNADGISKAASHNLLDIKAKGALGKASQIFFVSARIAWCNRHTYELLKNGDFTITRYKKDNTPDHLDFTWQDCKVVVHPELDIVLIQFPKTLTPYPTFMKHIISDKDLDFKMLPAGRIVTRREGVMTYIQSPSPAVIEKATIQEGELIPAGSAIGYTNMNTIVGDCGAPFVILDPTRQRKICGLHFLGNSFGTGQSVLVTQELLQSMMDAGDFVEDLQYQHSFTGVTGETIVDLPIGQIPTPFEPTKTKVRHSIIHGMVSEPITAPSILRVSAVCDPMERGVKELHKKKHIVPQTFVEQAQQVLTRYTSGEVQIARTLTLDEALSAKGIVGLEPIDISTSAGLPLCLEPDAKGKSKWINLEREPTQEFREMMDCFIGELKSGELKDIPIFKETLKDERVKKAKANINDPTKIKTRLFSASPLKLLVALRMYYGAFMAHVVRNQIRNTSTTGTNPHGPDWQMIADWLHEVSTKVDDGDYSCFDTTQPSGFLQAVYDAIRQWYNMNGGTEEDDKIRRQLAELCYHPYRSARGVVYRTNGSLPSGLFGTTPINSGVNLVAFFFAFKKLYPLATSRDFLENVRSVSHGDDVLFSVSKEFEGFTSENIGKALAEVGMIFTPADKGGVASYARPIEETTFLKRGFKKIAGIYRAPLETTSSLEMANWITKTADPTKATIDNCEAAFRELAISENDTVIQERIRDAVYRTTNGRHTLQLVTQEEAIAALFKSF
ncbi:hypothetical protein 1 [Changjiang picorna-like virus 14]|uniref:hypothetical protein 1 n=1 Tax=Changjiang picorna-like virus 14 TaxID=1922787 RepID=UPI00090CCAD2|nr:hypothetical protein 1 [Changjiang picorna-like virus 14]APG78996.1 hypothetical protein 1 [Changjiang picorna-like virus 14]